MTLTNSKRCVLRAPMEFNRWSQRLVQQTSGDCRSRLRAQFSINAGEPRAALCELCFLMTQLSITVLSALAV